MISQRIQRSSSYHSCDKLGDFATTIDCPNSEATHSNSSALETFVIRKKFESAQAD